MNFREALFGNWPLKVTSVLLSMLLWVVAATEEPGSRVVPGRLIIDPPPGRTILSAPATVSVHLTGPRRELLKLQASGIKITRAIPDTVTGRRAVIMLSPSDLAIPRGINVRVEDLEPRAVAVELDSVSSREVTVHPIVEVEPQRGFGLIGAVQVTPGRVLVSGPADLVTKLESVSTLPVLLTHAEGGDIERRIAIDTSLLGPVRVIPSEVTLSLEVGEVSRRIFDGVPVHLPPSLGGLVPNPKAVRVEVRGGVARIGELTAESLLVLVDPDRAATVGRAWLRVVAPPGFTGLSIPDSVTLVRRIRG